VEELLVLLLELCGEGVLQLTFSALSEAGLHVVRNPEKAKSAGKPSAWLLVLGYALLGALAGGLSLLIFHNSFIHHPAARLANLVLSPVAGGLGMALLGAWRRRRGQDTIELDRFAYGFLFALAMSMVRFFFAR
jgi:hypothetical protein